MVNNAGRMAVGLIVVMTKAELEETKKALRETRKAATKSKDAALAYLREIGMVDENGNLTAEYDHDKAA